MNDLVKVTRYLTQVTKLGNQSFVLADKTQCLELILNMLRLERRVPFNIFITQLSIKGCCGFFRKSFKKQKSVSRPHLLNCYKFS